MTYFPDTSAAATGASAGAETAVKTARLSLRQRAAAFWLNLLFWTVGWAPWVARITITFWIWMAWIFSPALRRYTLINARHLLGQKADTPAVRSLARSILRSFYLFIFDMGRHVRMTPAQMRAQVASITGEEHYEAARKLKRGVIIATAHIGSFEAAAASLGEREPRMNIIFRRDRFGLFDGIRSRLHAKLGIREVTIDEGVTAWLAIGEALGRDEVVLMQADRVMPGQRGIIVPFLDAALELPIGPAKLSLLTGAPIVPVFALRREDGRIDIRIHPPIETSPESDRNVAAITGRLALVLEKVIGDHPSQWLALHDAWHGTDGITAAKA